MFDFAIGDVSEEEAGSASGSLSAVQVLAAALGSAIITSLWFQHLPDGAATAMSWCLAVVSVVTLACTVLVRLLPDHAGDSGH